MNYQEKTLKNEQFSDLVDYTQNYSIYGKKVDQIDFCSEMLSLIASLLPQNYKAADLGCNSRQDITYIESKCSRQGKSGVFLAVDPYSQRQDILKMTSQEFVTGKQYTDLDLMSAKYSIHFNKNQQLFFENAYEILKDNGLIFILAKTKQCQFPWTEPLQRTFNDSCFKEEEIPKNLFYCQKIKRSNKIQIIKKAFIDFMQTRSYSNLLKNTQSEISQCVEFLRNNPEENLIISTVTVLYILRKKNNS